MNELPDTWVEIEVGEIAVVVGGGTPKASDPTNFAPPPQGIPWLTPADLSGYTNKTIGYGKRNISEKGYSSSSAKLMPKGSILFTSRAPIGYVAVAENEITTNQGFKSFVFTEHIHSDYAYYYFKSIKNLAEARGTGTTFKELSGAAAKKLPFIIAPFNEQVRLANTIDNLLFQVDFVKARIDSIPEITKRFRQSVLTAAVSGDLINKKSTHSEELKEIVDILNGDRVPISAAKRKEIQGDIPYYGATGIVDFLNDFTHEGRLLLVGEDGANLLTKSKDLAYIVDGKMWVNNHAHVIRQKAGYNLDYIKIVINSLDLSPWITGSAQPKLTKKNLETLPVPKYSLEEQTEIVKKVEKLFAFAYEIENLVSEAQCRINQFAQSILAKGFRGELISQDSNDETAKELLKRIKLEREEIDKLTKKIKNKKTTKKVQSKIGSKMTKTRFDEDVKGKAYLAGLLKNLSGEGKADDLFVASKLPIDDFYKQLSWEINNHFIHDVDGKLEIA